MNSTTAFKLLLLFLLSGLAAIFSTNAFSQNSSATKHVSGRVTDENGNGMPGVSITLLGTSTGTSTDSTGNFSLNVPGKNALLSFSSINYLNREGKVGH